MEISEEKLYAMIQEGLNKASSEYLAKVNLESVFGEAAKEAIAQRLTVPPMIDVINLGEFPFSMRQHGEGSPGDFESYIEFLEVVGADYKRGNETTAGNGNIYFFNPINPMPLIAETVGPQFGYGSPREIVEGFGNLRILSLMDCFPKRETYEHNMVGLINFCKKQDRDNLVFKLSTFDNRPLEIQVGE